MTARAVISEIKRLSPLERGKVFAWVERQMLVDDDLPAPQWHKDLLDERAREVKEGRAKLIPWETAKKQIAEMIAARKKSRRDARK
jgi:hypothetical protein